jgi:hypothetical protein
MTFVTRKARTVVGCAAALVLGSTFEGGRAHAAVSDSVHAALARDLTIGLDFVEAHSELAAGSADDPTIALESGRLALYEGDCDAALILLARSDVAKTDEGASLADIARGCVRVTAGTVVDKDDAGAVEVRYQDDSDRPLTPLIVETVVRARDALTRDLGATWPKPTRITVVRDLMSLSAMTGLPQKDAQTTGTVAVAKWGRITLLSPRATHHGYTWRDTIAHELTHLAVTRATVDRAPLWLQEGVAKRQEVRWREPGAFDDRPSSDAIVAQGIARKLDRPLDQLGPSIAMLPSADAAMVAFSEVTSFVRYLATIGTPDVLPSLFAALRANQPVDDALVATTGSNLKNWDTKWRAHISSEPAPPIPALFGLGATQVDVRELQKRVRLAELLYGRDHVPEALGEVDRITSPEALEDGSVRYLRARVLESLGRQADGEPLVADPKDVASSFGPWWAIRGRWARARGDETTAGLSFFEALAADPLDVEVACEGIDAASTPKSLLQRPLCDASRARHEPPIGRE